MHLAVKCLLGLAVLAAPCVYDPSSPEPSPIAAFVTPASTPVGASELAAVHFPDTRPALVP